jgi:hypothetical protein
MQRVDHLVYATPDIESARRDLEATLGVRASDGGSHPARGTRNALIAVGPACYIEIIGPDPEQTSIAHARWFGIDDLKTARLVTWAAKAGDIDSLVAEAAAEGIELGSVGSGNRLRPDGVGLSWRFTDPTQILADGLVPFFIDWGGSPHPAATAARGPALVHLRAEHPEPEPVRRILRALGLDLPVERGNEAALIARFQNGSVDLELR